MLALKDNIQRFESMHGPIKNIEEGGTGGNIPLNFGGTTPQA